jgi:hypothetical protein
MLYYLVLTILHADTMKNIFYLWISHDALVGTPIESSGLIT